MRQKDGPCVNVQLVRAAVNPQTSIGVGTSYRAQSDGQACTTNTPRFDLVEAGISDQLLIGVRRRAGCAVDEEKCDVVRCNFARIFDSNVESVEWGEIKRLAVRG